MDYIFKSHIANAIFQLFSADKEFKTPESKQVYSIIWNRGNDANIVVDGIIHKLSTHNILTLTPSQNFKTDQGNSDLLIFQFNENFYCVGEHDKEISCIGFIFYGTSDNIVITLSETEQHTFNLLLEMFVEEFQNQDNIQGEMLTILLKRLIIKCTRLAKLQQYGDQIEEGQYELIRQFNIAVEIHFREQHNVSFYAELLHKSPKTLANLFAKASPQSPIQLIHSRIITEARRQILFSGKSIKEIAFELHFPDIQSFSRFFKLKVGQAPNDFKKGKTNK
ncbi:MAG: helix-turn-helix domain-containing protein [Ferruginibacter sp.]